VNNSTNINKTNSNLSPETIQHKESTTYGAENPCPIIGSAQKCGGIKPVMGSQPLQRQYRYKQLI
jgi:hypothetical protein